MDYLARLRATSQDFARLRAAADPAAAVPACGGWTVTDLIAHLGAVEAWAAQILRTGAPAELATPPTAHAAAVALQDTAAAALAAALADTDPDAPVWGFGPPPRTAAFWFRRQAHEHAIHLLDLYAAGGLPAPSVDPEFALDGVDEVLNMFHPRQIRLGRAPAPAQPVLIVDADSARQWRVAAPADTSATVATMTASAGVLYAGLWGRADLLDASGVEITGDRNAVAALLATALVP